MCANFVYDLNGSATPNQLGKDVGFITVFLGPNKEVEVVAPNPIGKNLGSYKWADGIQACKNIEGYRMPSMYEMASKVANRYLDTNISTGGGFYWTSSSYSAGAKGKAYRVYSHSQMTPSYTTASKTTTQQVYCIKEE